MTDNIKLAKHWYANVGPDMVTDDIIWKLADGFPADGTYHGSKQVFEVWWPKLIEKFSKWEATPQTFLDAGEAAVVLGVYSGVAKQTGKAFEVPFTHVWWFNDEGKVSRMYHNANTKLFDEALDR